MLSCLPRRLLYVNVAAAITIFFSEEAFLKKTSVENEDMPHGDDTVIQSALHGRKKHKQDEIWIEDGAFVKGTFSQGMRLLH